MTESRDMDAPVTRRELHETLDLWGNAFEQRIERRFENFMAGVKALFEAFEVRLVEMEARLMRELRSQTKASEDELASRPVAVDEQYKDLPARVTRLETKVFPPRKPRRRRAS